jgi:NADPH:quinone reductase-like Zn-dependent oxidoreductase
MKAWQFSAITSTLEAALSLNPTATPPPPPKKDDSLIEVVAVSINPVDYKFAEIPLLGRLLMSRPASPCLDYCGRVVSSGKASLKPGQLVFGRLAQPTQFGTLAQYTITPTAGTIPVPAGVSPEDAASIGTAGLTAYQCIAPNVKPGNNVFINGGSGGTGVFGIQIAKTLGCRVTASCSTGNIALCRSLGADEVIDYKSVDVLKTLSQGGEQYDLVVDNAGSPANLYANSHHFLRPSGKFVQVAGDVSVSGMLGLVSRMVRPAVLGGGKRKFEFIGLGNKEADFVKLVEWMRDGKVRSVIEETFKWEEAPKAFERSRTGRAKGKIVIKVGE